MYFGSVGQSKTCTLATASVGFSAMATGVLRDESNLMSLGNPKQIQG